MHVYGKYDRPPKVPFKNYGPGRTRQSEAAACDINNIMERYQKTGIIPAAVREALYADVSSVGDYQEAVNRVATAERLFSQLPAKVRSEFGNDVAYFLDFCSDPENRDRMVELGLIEDASPVESAPVAPAAASEPPPADPPPEPST